MSRKPIDILGIPWTVEFIKMRDEDLWGRSVNASHRIDLATEAQLPKQQQTLFHELIHAISSSVMPPEADVSEAIVKPMSRALWHVLRSNPEWADWILGKRADMP